MPNYYNPYNLYPASYGGAYGYNSYSPNMSQQPSKRRYIEWVQGEVGATAFQQPPDLDVNQPIPLWDSTDTVIYMKSWGPMGIPNQMQVIRYKLPENQMMLPANSGAQDQNVSGATEPHPEYVTKDDLNQMKQEIQAMFSQQYQPQNSQVQANLHNNQNGTRRENKG